MANKGPIRTAKLNIPPKGQSIVPTKEKLNNDVNMVLDLPVHSYDLKQIAESIHERFWEASPIADMKPPFFVRLEVGTGNNSPVGICVGKYFTMRHVWHYRVIYPRRISAKNSERSFGEEDVPGHNLTPIPNEMVDQDLLDLLKEIKKIDNRINKAPDGPMWA